MQHFRMEEMKTYATSTQEMDTLHVFVHISLSLGASNSAQTVICTRCEWTVDITELPSAEAMKAWSAAYDCVQGCQQLLNDVNCRGTNQSACPQMEHKLTG
jgi:hypothetical protein